MKPKKQIYKTRIDVVLATDNIIPYGADRLSLHSESKNRKIAMDLLNTKGFMEEPQSQISEKHAQKTKVKTK